ncbi:MAG: vWA domain-containing protein [Pseudomonadota bacterium]
MAKMSPRMVLIALVATSSTSISSAQAATDAGFCRRPPTLMTLKPEQPVALFGGARLIRAAAPDVPEGMQMCPDGSIIPVAEPCPPPPPPPPTPVPERGGGDDSIVVTGSRIEGSRSASVSAPAEEVDRSDRRARQFPPAGLLTAGDHDDLLNPELYAFYANKMRDLGQAIPSLPILDTRRTLTVELKDEQGRQMALQPVTVECSDGNTITLSSQSDGRVVFFPELDRLSAKLVLAAGGERREIALSQRRSTQVHSLILPGEARSVDKMDLMIVLDCTGSMGDEIAFLKSELRAILDDLKRRHPNLDLRVGLVAYRDIGDEFVTRTYRLTPDLDALQSAIAKQSGSGGGDMPEAVDEALARGIDQQWRDDALRTLVLIADAPPHDDKMRIAFDAAEIARAKRVQIVPVASSGVDDRAEYFMRASAALTQSRYVFLTDDSGIGNPHAEPDVACYVVTSLASTIRRVLDSQLSGRRIEPSEQEVIRVNGIYDNGKCRLPAGFSVQPKKPRKLR